MGLNTLPIWSPWANRGRVAWAAGRSLALAVVAVASLSVVSPSAHAALRDLAPPLAQVVASAPALSTAPAGRVRFSLALSEATDYQIFELREPSRLVIDLPELEWRLHGEGAGAKLDFEAYGGVEKLRVGLFRPGRSRLVLDLSAPPVNLTHTVAEEPAGGARLTLEFGFQVGDAASTASDIAPGAALQQSPRAPQVAAKPRKRPTPFTIVIDPGHGGRDPGAVSPSLREKDVVLAVAKRLRDRLARDPRIHVVMTRETDRFVELEDRVALARDVRADLFLSVHADSLPQHPEVSGASVYTLSDAHSERIAAKLSGSVLAAEALGGIEDAPSSRVIRDIVVDYKRRVVMEDSDAFAKIALASMGRQIPVLRSRPHRYAGFKVLKNFNAPSALVELGFLTNLKDRRRLGNPAWQETAAATLADAIRAWSRRDIVEKRMATALAAPY